MCATPYRGVVNRSDFEWLSVTLPFVITRCFGLSVSVSSIFSQIWGSPVEDLCWSKGSLASRGGSTKCKVSKCKTALAWSNKSAPHTHASGPPPSRRREKKIVKHPKPSLHPSLNTDSISSRHDVWHIRVPPVSPDPNAPGTALFFPPLHVCPRWRGTRP